MGGVRECGAIGLEAAGRLSAQMACNGGRRRGVDVLGVWLLFAKRSALSFNGWLLA